MKIDRNNLLIFGFNKEKKYILQRTTAIVAAIVTMGALSSCDNTNEPSRKHLFNYNSSVDNETKYQDTSKVNDNYSSSDSFDFSDNYSNSDNFSNTNNDFSNKSLNENDITFDEQLYTQIVNSNVSMDKNELLNFEQSINSIEVSYPYSELYGMADSLKNYNELNKSITFENTLIENNQVNFDKFYNLVVANNEELVSSKKTSHSNVKQICEIVCEIANNYLSNNPDADYGLLSKKLSTLKIEQYSGLDYGYYNSQKNTIGMNPDVDTERLRKVIIHEVYHFLQNGPSAVVGDSNVESQSGFCYVFKNDKMNALNFTWLSEGGAEYLSMDYNKIKDPEIYTNVITNMQTIKTATILNKNNNTTNFEKLSLSNDLSDLFKYFNVTDDENKMEILNMMYAYELVIDLNQYSSSRTFYNLYRNEVNKYDLEDELKESIAKTLTKQFYSNLSEFSNIKVKDAFSIISIYENELSRFLWYESKASKYQDFFTVYNDIQRGYFELVANKLGVDAETLIEMYTKYNTENTIDSYSIDILDSDKQEFYDYIAKTRQGSKKNSIDSVSKKNGGKIK